MTETLNFGKAPAPALRSGRTSEANPFTPHFPTTLDAEGNVEALTLEFDGTAESNKAKTTNLTGKARRAAEKLDPPMTARVQVNEVEEGTGKAKKVKTVMYIWTVEKITRQSADQTADGQPATE